MIEQVTPKSEIIVRMKDICARLDLDEAGAASYLGVPVYTVRKWISGERVPSAVVFRLLDVLGVIEAISPEVHRAFMPSVPKKKQKQVMQ